MQHVEAQRHIAEHWRWAAFATLVVLVGLVTPAATMNDWLLFHPAGVDLLTGHWDVFETYPHVYAGPLGLVAAGVTTTRRAATVFGAVLLVVGLRIASPVWDRRTAVAGLIALVPWMLTSSVGHAFDDQLSTVLLVAATTLGARGLWVGLAILAKPSALLALPILRARELVVAATVLAVAAAPFLIAGARPFPSTQHNPVQDGSPLHLVVSGALPQWWRVAQLVAMLATAWFVGRRAGPLAAVIAGTCVRFLLDPNGFSYAAGSIALLGAVWAIQGRGWAPLILSWPVMAPQSAPAAYLVHGAALLAIAGVVCGTPHGKDLWSSWPLSRRGGRAHRARDAEQGP